MTDLAFRTKTHWFLDRKLACRLRPNHLHCERGWSRDFAYDEIQDIRIICYWSRGGVRAVHAIVRGAAGRVTIPSYSDRFLQFPECQAGGFVPFIEELVERVSAANPSATFSLGSTGVFALNMLVAASLAVMGIILLGVGGGAAGGISLAVGGALALYGTKLGVSNRIGAQALRAKLRGHLGSGDPVTAVRGNV